MHDHRQNQTMFQGAIPEWPFLRSLRRDWLSWSRLERAGAVAILLGAPLGLALTLGAQV